VSGPGNRAPAGVHKGARPCAAAEFWGRLRDGTVRLLYTVVERGARHHRTPVHALARAGSLSLLARARRSPAVSARCTVLFIHCNQRGVAIELTRPAPTNHPSADYAEAEMVRYSPPLLGRDSNGGLAALLASNASVVGSRVRPRPGGKRYIVSNRVARLPFYGRYPMAPQSPSRRFAHARRWPRKISRDCRTSRTCRAAPPLRRGEVAVSGSGWIIQRLTRASTRAYRAPVG